MIPSELTIFILKLKSYKDNVLYSNETDEYKSKEYISLYEESKDVCLRMTKNVQEYILKKLLPLCEINMYSVPAVVLSIDDVIERYYIFYNLDRYPSGYNGLL